MKITNLRIGRVQKSGYHGSIDITIKENGDLDMGLFEYGELVEKYKGGDYEYDLIVEKDYKDSMLLYLIKERFQDISGFKKWLEDHDIPPTETSY